MPEKKFGSEGKLFIGGLTYNTSDEMLKDYYSQWGRLVDFIVMKDPETKRSRGFGFVTYADSACADLAMDGRPHILDGKTVEAKRAMPRESDPSQPAPKAMPKSDKGPPVKRLFLSGVKEEHTEQMFLEHFASFGPVLSVDIVVDKATGKKRGFGYVTFDSYDAVEKAIVNKSHMIGGLRCDVKKALSKEEMGKSSSSQYGRDRMERDARSRGTGRGDGYGYGGGFPQHGQNSYQGYSTSAWNPSPQQMPGGGSWTQSGYQSNGPATATYYPPSYGGSSAAGAYAPTSYAVTQSSYAPSPGSHVTYPTAGGASSYGQPGSYPPNWSVNSQPDAGYSSAAPTASGWSSGAAGQSAALGYSQQQQQQPGAASWAAPPQQQQQQPPSSATAAYVQGQAAAWPQGSRVNVATYPPQVAPMTGPYRR